MKKFWADYKSLLIIFTSWWIFILLTFYFALNHLTPDPTFPYYAELIKAFPREVAVFAHFDGIHYLRIATQGYDADGLQVFFPLYPLLIRAITLFTKDPLLSAINISNVSLFLGLLIFISQVKREDRWKTILFYLSIPTSFYFILVYTESLFLLLLAISWYFLGKKKFLLSALFIGLLTATRNMGVGMTLVLAWVLWENRQPLLKSLSLIFISLSGLLSYMYFLWSKFNDPLAFIHSQSVFAMGRSSDKIILLPQVIFRYLKMILTVDFSYLYVRVWVELLVFLGALYVVYYLRKKLKPPVLIYSLFVILFPTLSGSLVAIPRYLLIAAPLFFTLAANLPSRIYWLLIAIQSTFLFIALSLFVKGWFVS